MGSYKCNVVAVINMGAYIHGCLPSVGAYYHEQGVSLYSWEKVSHVMFTPSHTKGVVFVLRHAFVDV